MRKQSLCAIFAMATIYWGALSCSENSLDDLTQEKQITLARRQVSSTEHSQNKDEEAKDSSYLYVWKSLDTIFTMDVHGITQADFHVVCNGGFSNELKAAVTAESYDDNCPVVPSCTIGSNATIYVSYYAKGMYYLRDFSIQLQIDRKL